MEQFSKEEIAAINARIDARRIQDELEAEQYWQNTYPALPYEDRKKVWEKHLWLSVRNGDYGRTNMDYIGKDYLSDYQEKEPDIKKIFDEILQASDWINEQFGEGTIELIRQRIKS